MHLETKNPATGEIIKQYPLFSYEKITALIDAAHLCFLSWRTTSFSQRRQRMLTMADLLQKKQDELAHLMAMEMGKPISAGKAEISKCVWACKHYAEQTESYLAARLIETEMSKTKVCYQPLGVIFAIMPWNFPFWQVFRFAAPNLMAGNAAILKHAPICTGTGNRIAELFLEAGFPEHLFQHFILDNDLATDVIANEKIKGVTLTGSEKAGQAIASEAGAKLKKVVLELGGNDPYIVLQDADLELAANCITTSRMNNTGQVCIAAKRIIVVKDCHEALVNKIMDKICHYQVGDPLDEKVNFGPMAREDLRNTVQDQVNKSIEKGAKKLIGGEILPGKGFYYPPTVLINVKPGMPAFDDEIFGPVVAIIKADDEAHAISLANQSRFGLGAAVFTSNLERGENIATYEIEAGSCFVNALVASDPRVPFGGIRHSGYGRELSREGVMEFVNIKTVSIK